MNKGLLFIGIAVLCFGCQRSLSEKEVEEYTEMGMKISQETYQKLSGALMEKMKAGGIPEAVKYCNAAALPLTQEISEAHNVHVKRTALRTRNQSNSPNEEELRILNYYKDLADKKQDLTPLVQLDQNGNPHYYAPIILQKKCLSCHGRLDKEVSRAADSIIKSYYPNDMALGFQENDLRGIWSISFPVKN